MRAFSLLLLMILLLLVCCSVPASAESPTAGLQTPRTCSECVILTPAEVEQEKPAMGELLRRAYEAGRREEKAGCRSLL